MLKSGWEVKTLGDIAEVKGGKRVPKGYVLQSEPTKHPYLTVSDFSDDGAIDTSKLRYISDDIFESIKRYTISSFDLYLSIAGTIGKTGYVPIELDGANLTENACKLVLNSVIDRGFIYYFTKSNDFLDQVGINTRTTTQPKLALERLKTIQIPVPPILEQKRIVAILDEAFANISQTVANAEKNLANARELFDSYLNEVFTRKGEGWEEERLSSLCQEITVGHVGSMVSQYKDSGIIFLRSQNIQAFDVNLNNIRFIDDDFHASLRKSSLKPDDVAIVRTGYPGTAAVIPCSIPVANCSDIVIVRVKEKLNPHYLVAVMNSDFGKRSVGLELVGAAQKHFNVSAAKNMLIPLPDRNAQEKIVSNIYFFRRTIEELEDVYRRKLAVLAELKQALLQKAFTGELTAADQPT